MEAVLVLTFLIQGLAVAFGGDDNSTIGKFLLFGGGQAINGDENRRQELVEIWSPDYPARIHLLPTPHLFYQTVTALPNGDILVCGGWPYSNDDSIVDSCYLLDPIKLRTTPTAPLHWPLQLHAAAALGSGSDVFLCGGIEEKEDDEWLTKSECLRYRDGVWSETAPMSEPRIDFVLASNGSALYACGGQGQGGYENGETLNICEVYDPEKDIWTPSVPLPTAQSRACGVCADDGRLYVVGTGKDEKDVDVFDPVTGTWSKGPRLSNGRRGSIGPTGCNVVNVDGAIWAFGHDEVVEVLELGAKEWRSIPFSLVKGWPVMGAVFVHPVIHNSAWNSPFHLDCVIKLVIFVKVAYMISQQNPFHWFVKL